MSAKTEEQAKHFRDVADFAVTRVNGLFEVVEAAQSGPVLTRMFLVTTSTTIYLAKFALGSSRVTMRNVGDPAEMAAAVERETKLRDAQIELFASCGMAAVTTVGGFVAGAPTGGAAWVLLLGRGLVAWTECGLAVDKYFSLKGGTIPYVETTGGKVVNVAVKAGDVVFVGTDVIKSARLVSGLGKKTMLGISDDMVRGYASIKLVVQAGELALKSDNLIRAGRELRNDKELIAAMASHVAQDVARQAERLLKIPIYGNWCGPGYGSGEPIDLVDRGCRIHDNCYGQHGYFRCQCDQDLIRTLQSLPAALLSRRGQIARWSIMNWFTHIQTCR